MSTKISPEKAAKKAGLRYVSDEMPGIYRQQRGRGFSYQLPSGDRLEPGPEKDRIEALVIPPNWQDVWICTDPDGHLQENKTVWPISRVFEFFLNF